ncbi:hypothetical protein INT47_011795 [Mucor saturninus]|uniref:Uncharacterized protein n=1 Tax=Mucor saturninus TaxID=64648 RepID=A0A8H7RC93_9FUNG|nr:hypothetical protein INT47_011795 [Mucor saturninus]
MNIASLIIEPSLFPHMSHSTLSSSDRSFIEFTRCLYKVKSVVQELQAFEKSVGPTPFGKEQNHDFIQHVNLYLEESFQKFNHMCKVLLIVLTKLESNHPVRRERIDSFRQEIIYEWRKAITVRQDLVILLETNTIIPSPYSMADSDNESDTSTLEPTTSSDSSSS